MFKAGDAAAIMPLGSRSPLDAMSIASVREAGPAEVTLVDGTVYRFKDGLWTSDDVSTHLVAATSQHIKAVHAQTLKAGIVKSPSMEFC
jgi:hypothetical protein